MSQWRPQDSAPSLNLETRVSEQHPGQNKTEKSSAESPSSRVSCPRFRFEEAGKLTCWQPRAQA